MVHHIPHDEWENTISNLRERQFPPDTNIGHVEKELIKLMLSSTPNDRPDISELNSVIDNLIDTCDASDKDLLVGRTH